MAVLTRHLTDELVPPRERVPDLADAIDERVEAIVMRAMAKKPEDRYPGVEAMCADLEAALAEMSDPHVQIQPELARGSLPMRRLSDQSASSRSGEQHVRSPQAYDTTAPHSKLDPDEELDTDSTGCERLRREDLDDYERSLKRRGWLRTLAVPLTVIALAAGAALTLRWWQRRPRTVEEEPNNDAAHATRVGDKRSIRGKIQGRVDDSTGDADFFVLPGQAGAGARVLTARLDAIPNIDLELDVMDESGRALARADATSVGGPEVLPDVRSDGRDLYLVVREVPVSGKFPMENTRDSYRLSVATRPLRGDEAAEPCDDQSPGELVAGRATTGYLGQPSDRDVFRLEATGRMAIEVSGIDGVDIVLEAAGTVVDAGAAGAPERGEVAWAPGAQVVVWRKDAKGSPAEREAVGARAVGLDQPYRINVTLLQ